MQTLQLEAQNLGKPTCPTIKINPKNWGSNTEPQACEKDGAWYYNWEAMMAECKYTGKTVPTHEEWQEILKETPSNKIFIFVGFRDIDATDTFRDRTTVEYVWSSFEASATDSWFEYFYSSDPTQSYSYSNAKAYGFSVRCLKN